MRLVCPETACFGRPECCFFSLPPPWLKLRGCLLFTHLRLGEWILANKTWPTTGLFSQASQLPWRDFTWFGDATLAIVYRALGLSAVPALGMVYRVVLAVITFFLASGSRDGLWIPVIISGLAQYLLYGVGPVGVGTSAAFFGVALLALLLSRNTGKLQPLFWLPLLFLFWANLDLGFVYGIAPLVIFLVTLGIKEISSKIRAASFAGRASGIPLGTAALVGVACFVASLLSPYGYHAYSAFFSIQSSPANEYLFAHTAMSFHRPEDYLLLLLRMAAFLCLGLRRSYDLFLILVLIGSTALAFRAQGNNWLATLAGVAVIADSLPETNVEAVLQVRRRWFLLPGTISLAAVLLAWLALVPRDRQVLISRVAAEFPMGACDYIRGRQVPAPLFNSYTCGSFLAWYLPEYPVAIDARRGLYPDDLETGYFKVTRVLIPYQSLAPMKDARTLLLDKQNVMADTLRMLPGFQVAYEDKISIVLLQQWRD